MDDLLNPFAALASAAGKVVADAWTAAMLGLWNAGLWLLRLALTFLDFLLTPDLSEDGPGAWLYQVMFWIAAALLVIMLLVQLGVAVAKRDGQGLARVALGLGQFVVVWAGWIVYGVTIVTAAGGLTRALMQGLLNVTSWTAWQPWEPFTPADITDGTVATVLGLMGLLLWLAAIGHFLIMLVRSAALMVLVATTPIAAAGLVSEAGRSWFWKSLRWFHAAATDEQGRSAGEDSAGDATTGRFNTAVAGGLSQLGPIGQLASTGLGLIAGLGAAGASLGADLTNQMGVGHNTYPPDFSRAGRRATHDRQQSSDPGGDRTPNNNGDPNDSGRTPDADPPVGGGSDAAPFGPPSINGGTGQPPASPAPAAPAAGTGAAPAGAGVAAGQVSASEAAVLVV